MARGRRKAAEPAQEPVPEPIPEPEPIPAAEPEPQIYRFEQESPRFTPVIDTNLEGIAHTARFSVNRQYPDLKCHTRCSEQIYAITRNGRELYFKIPNLPFDLVVNLWAAAKDNISIEDFLIELQTISGVRPIILHTEYDSLL